LIDRTKAALEGAGLRCVASVRESQSEPDLAFLASGIGPIVVRCVERPVSADYSELETMLSEGPFCRAIIVCKGYPSEAHEWTGVETWPIEEIDERAAALAMQPP
jgi:hypothetical protein